MRSEQDDEFAEFVRTRLPALHGIAYRLCGDDDRADDLLQDALAKLYVRWSKVRLADNLDGYARTVLVRTYIDETRRPWSRVRLYGEPPDRIAPPTPGTEDRTAVRAALANLPPGQRAVLVLRFLCDLPVTEVAALLGHSEGTVRSQTSHGLAKLRRSMDRSDFTMTKGVPEHGA
jgi:RNA polymerase sigma-70 factor (sigma-E family)